MPMSPRLLRPRQAGGFDPRTIPGLAVWLDGKDNASVLNSISPDTPATITQTVRRWRDRSGDGNDADQDTGANQPTYESGGLLNFDGSNDRLSLSNLGLAANKTFLAVFAVFRPDVTTSATRHLFMFRNNAAAARAGSNISSDGTLSIGGRRLDADSFQGVNSSALSNGTTYIMSAIFDYGGQNLVLRLNGATSASSSSFHAGGATSNTNSSEVTIGGFVLTSTFFDGQFGAFLVYNGATLTQPQWSAIERYLGARYGVAVA
jgi:hypothetical protein